MKHTIYERYYVAGMFDSDGCFCHQYKYPHIVISLARKHLIDYIRSVLDDIGIVYGYSIVQPHGFSKKVQFRIDIREKASVKLFFDTLPVRRAYYKKGVLVVKELKA